MWTQKQPSICEHKSNPVRKKKDNSLTFLRMSHIKYSFSTIFHSFWIYMPEAWQPQIQLIHLKKSSFSKKKSSNEKIMPSTDGITILQPFSTARRDQTNTLHPKGIRWDDENNHLGLAKTHRVLMLISSHKNNIKTYQNYFQATLRQIRQEPRTLKDEHGNVQIENLHRSIGPNIPEYRVADYWLHFFKSVQTWVVTTLLLHRITLQNHLLQV